MRSRWLALARAALGLGFVGFFVLGSSTTQRVRPAPPPPQIRIEAEPLQEAPARCQPPDELERLKGPVPPNAFPVLKMTLTVDQALPLAALEDALAARAREACCDGLSLLRAVADEGATGFIEASATGWRLPAEEPTSAP